MSTQSTESGISDQVHLEIEFLQSEVAGSKASDVVEHPSESEALHTLLVADDNPEIRAYVKRCLKALRGEIGHILEAGDGATALARIRQGDVDLVISDVVMPHMNGFALCRALQEDEALRHIPLLLITGELSARELQEHVDNAGCCDILIKPFNARKLCAQVSRLLSRAPPKP